MQQQQQQPPKDHNLKRKAAEPEDVAEEDSENEVVESPEVKKARMKYLKRLYSGNKQQSEVVLETEEKKEEESHSEEKAESQKKKSEGIWSNAKQSEVVVEKRKESHSNEDDAEIQKKKSEGIWSNAKQSEVQSEVVVVVVEQEESQSNEVDPEIQKKKYEDICRQANMLKHVAPIPAIAEAITDTPDALLPLIKMDPKTFCLPPLNSVARKWLGSTTSSTVISFESKKQDDADDNDDDDLEDATSHKTNGKKSKAASAKKKSNDEDSNADDEDDVGSAGGAASRWRTKKKSPNVTIVYLEKYGIELPESTKKLIEKSQEKYICCANAHRMRAGPFVDTDNKRSKKNLNLNSKTKPAADDGSKNDSNDEEVALTASEWRIPMRCIIVIMMISMKKMKTKTNLVFWSLRPYFLQRWMIFLLSPWSAPRYQLQTPIFLRSPFPDRLFRQTNGQQARQRFAVLSGCMLAGAREAAKNEIFLPWIDCPHFIVDFGVTVEIGSPAITMPRSMLARLPW